VATVIDLQVSATADDAMQTTEDTWFSNSVTYSFVSYTNHDTRSYHRFVMGATPIPSGAIITAAYLTFTGYEDSAGANILRVQGFLEDDVGDFPDRATADSYGLTVQLVDWTPGAWTTGNEFNSDDLTAIVQEIVDLMGGIATNEHLGLRTDTTTRVVNKRARSYDFAGNADGVKLHIEFTVAATYQPRPAGMAVGTTQIY